MTAADLDDVVSLEAEVQVTPWSAALFARELGQPDRQYAVVRTDTGDLAGFGGLWLSLEDAHITTLVVAPAHRRQGIGSALVDQLLQLAVEMGAGAATLEVRAGNTAAIELYRGFGFAPVGVRPRYYPSGSSEQDREDAIIMWLHDLPDRDPGRRTMSEEVA